MPLAIKEDVVGFEERLQQDMKIRVPFWDWEWDIEKTLPGPFEVRI